MGPGDFCRWKTILMEPWWFIRAPSWSWSTLVPLPKAAQKTGFFRNTTPRNTTHRKTTTGPLKNSGLEDDPFVLKWSLKRLIFGGGNLIDYFHRKFHESLVQTVWEIRFSGDNMTAVLVVFTDCGRQAATTTKGISGISKFPCLEWRLMFIENVWELTHLQKNAGLFLPFLEARWCVFLFTWWDSWKYLRLQIETEAFGMKSPACEGVYPLVIFFMGYNAWTHNLQKQWRSWFLQPWARTF